LAFPSAELTPCNDKGDYDRAIAAYNKAIELGTEVGA